MAIYRTISEIPNGFLRDIIMSAERFLQVKFDRMRMTSDGECAITFKGHLTDRQIGTIVGNLEKNPTGYVQPKMCVNYDYLQDDTVIYTPDGIDYRKL